jgi:hypothetical protein
MMVWMMKVKGRMANMMSHSKPKFLSNVSRYNRPKAWAVCGLCLAASCMVD